MTFTILLFSTCGELVEDYTHPCVTLKMLTLKEKPTGKIWAFIMACTTKGLATSNKLREGGTRQYCGLWLDEHYGADLVWKPLKIPLHLLEHPNIVQMSNSCEGVYPEFDKEFLCDLKPEPDLVIKAPFMHGGEMDFDVEDHIEYWKNCINGIHVGESWQVGEKCVTSISIAKKEGIKELFSREPLLRDLILSLKPSDLE
jgi:hypothetical protein